jgi:NTE family protein
MEKRGMSIVPILSGGGTRLPAHVGVLAALQDMGVSYTHLAGVSGGSVVAAMRAAGRSVPELVELFRGEDFRSFRGKSLLRLMTHGGLSSGKAFQAWLNAQLGGVRFKDLELDLHVVAADVLSGKPVIFDRQQTPKVYVAAAVRASMGIPLLFSYLPWRGKVLVDGSILEENVLRRDWAGDGTPAINFRLRVGQGRDAEVQPELARSDYLAFLLRTFLATLSREYVADRNWDNTVLIDTGPSFPAEFSLSLAEKMELFDQGYNTTREILPQKLARHAQPDEAAPPAA